MSNTPTNLTPVVKSATPTSPVVPPDTKPAVASQPAVAAKPAVPAPTIAKGVSLDKLETYVSVGISHPAAQAQYKFKGTCNKCGWQSLQPSRELAVAMVRTHAQKHLLQE
jgi:hypothetical protein